MRPQRMNKDDFAVFLDWNQSVHIQYHVGRKFIHAVRLNHRGFALVNLRRNKAVRRGIQYVPEREALDVVGKVTAGAGMANVQQEIKEILSEVYAGMGTTPREEGSKSGSPARTSAVSEQAASTTRAGAGG